MCALRNTLISSSAFERMCALRNTLISGSLHTSLVILTFWSRGRRLKRSNLCPNHYLYNVWATSQKSVARRISGRQKRSDGCHNSISNKNVIKPKWFWWFWCFWGAKNEAFFDFSLVLLMFRETWFGSFWRVFGPMDFHDFRVCDFALFYSGFWFV